MILTVHYLYGAAGLLLVFRFNIFGRAIPDDSRREALPAAVLIRQSFTRSVSLSSVKKISAAAIMNASDKRWCWFTKPWKSTFKTHFAIKCCGLLLHTRCWFSSRVFHRLFRVEFLKFSYSVWEELGVTVAALQRKFCGEGWLQAADGFSGFKL